MENLPEPKAKRICDYHRSGYCRPITPTEIEEAFNAKLYQEIDRYLDTVPGSEEASKLRLRRDTACNITTGTGDDIADAGSCDLPGPL